MPVCGPEGLLAVHAGAERGEFMIDEWPEAGKSSLSPFPLSGNDRRIITPLVYGIGMVNSAERGPSFPEVS